MKKLPLTNPEFNRIIEEFTVYLSTLGYSETTVYNLPHHIQEFFYWLEQEGFEHISTLNRKQVRYFMEYLDQRENQRLGGSLSNSYRNKYLQALKLLSKYLQSTFQGGFTVSSAGIQSESKGIKLLSAAEISTLYAHISDDFLGIRDKVMLALFYGCGLRRKEAVSLNVEDILLGIRQVYVRNGKGNKERYVPLSQPLVADISHYLRESRPQFKNAQTHPALLLSMKGKRIEGQSLNLRLSTLCERASLPKVTLHGLRHSIATHLLQNGMPLEYIAKFLGHSSLESTQLYTQLNDEL